MRSLLFVAGLATEMILAGWAWNVSPCLTVVLVTVFAYGIVLFRSEKRR